MALDIMAAFTNEPPVSFSEDDCTKYQESAALPELAACKAA